MIAWGLFKKMVIADQVEGSSAFSASAPLAIFMGNDFDERPASRYNRGMAGWFFQPFQLFAAFADKP